MRCLWTLFYPVLTILCLQLFIPVSSLYAETNQDKIKKNVLLITIDTLRANRLSCYSKEHLHTPNIDSLAERGILFSRAFAHTSTTLPSHTNIFCGTTPLYHGIHDNYNFILSKEFLTLAEHLKTFDYSTGAFIGGFPLDSRFGLDQGFDVYDDDFGKKSEGEIRAEFVVDKALAWLKLKESPWFLWVHCYDPHDPYTPPDPFRNQHEKVPYNGEVAYVDTVLKRLFSYLEKNDLYKNTLVVFTGDHGEALGQHGEMTHGYFAYNEVMWIPLIIYSPGIAKGRVDQYVSHIDIFPSVCDILNIEKPSFLQGRSLLPAMKGKKLPEKIIYYESLHPFYSKGWAHLRGFIEKKEKFIDSPIPEFYDLENDFGELNNLIKEKKLNDYRLRLEKIKKSLSNPKAVKPRKTIDQDALEKLRSLGYISDPNLPVKDSFGPEDDIKTLLPYWTKANWAIKLYQNKKMSLDSTMESLKDVLSDTEKIDIAYKGLAALYREKRRLKDAIEVLKAGIENHPSSYEILLDLVKYLSEAEQYQDVIILCEDFHMVQMDFEPHVWNMLGFAYMSTGDLTKAQKTFEKALSIDEKDASVLNNCGHLYLSIYNKTKKLSHHKKAVEFFKKSIEQDPNYVPAYDGLGIAYLIVRDLDKSIYYWKKTIELFPSHADSVYNLSRAYLTKGNKQKALALLTQYIKTYSHLLSPKNQKRFNELIKKCKN
jgi:arylsulfatase A-like enzyme/Flp pilus assembly protein TadD